MDRRGWSDIAYSYIIDRGTFEIYEGRGAGVQGGHTFGHNSVSHAICVMGNFEIASVPNGLIDQIAALVRHGNEQGWWPSILTGGHRDVGSTACPGGNLYAHIEEINRRAVAKDDDEEDDVALRKGAKGEAVRRFRTRSQRMERQVTTGLRRRRRLRRRDRDLGPEFPVGPRPERFRGHRRGFRRHPPGVPQGRHRRLGLM